MSQLASAVFTARLKSLQERAKAVRSSILRWNAYAQAQQLRPLFSQLSRGLHLLAPFRAEDPAVGYSPVQTDDLPRPLSAIPGDCGECWLVYPDRPDHWRRGELIPARHVSAPMLATELTQRSQQLRASAFVEELAKVGPYGEAGPDGFQPVTDATSGQTGVSLEQWDPESGSLRTVYPTSVVGGELILRIGEVTNRVRLMDPVFGRLVDVGGGVIEIETTDKNGAVTPHGYMSGDELDVLGHFIGAINVLTALPEGAMAYMEFYENNSASPIGGNMSNSIFKVVAKAEPGPLRTEQISGVDVTVLEFAIGQDIIESSRNLEAALNTVPGITSRFIIRRNYHQIMFFPRNTLVNGNDWTRHIGGIQWSLMHYGDVINYQYCMPYYPNVWFDEMNTKTTQGHPHATLRIGRSLPVVVISSTRIRVAVDADWAPLSMVALARVRKVSDNDLDAPYAMLRPMNASGTVDYDSIFQNLIASIKQSSAYGRYMEDFLTGVGGFTFAYAKGSGGQRITGLGLYHPAGVELAASKGSFRLENFYWSVPQGDAIGVDLPGVFGVKGDGPYRLYRRGELRALKATVTGRFSCQLDTPEDPDLASDRSARLGMIILEEAEVGAELFLGTSQVYTYAGGAWVTEGHTSTMQWMLRPYLRLGAGGLKMQATSRISEQSDHQVLYGPPVSLAAWCGPGVNEPFAALTGTPTPVYLDLELRDAGEGRLWMNLNVRRGATGPRATGLTGYLSGRTSGRFGLVTKFCTPRLTPDGKNANSQIQHIQFEGLRLLAPTGRYWASYDGEGARRLELHPGRNCFAQLSQALPEPSRVSKEVVVLPGQSRIPLDEGAERPGVSLSFVGFPSSGQWIELSTGGHRFYYLLTTDAAKAAQSYAVLIVRSGPRAERLAQLTDMLYDRLSQDENLRGLVEVGRQSLASWGSESSYINLRSARPGAHYNIQVKLLAADRVTQVSSSVLGLLYRDYRSTLRVLPQNLSLGNDSGQLALADLTLGAGELRVASQRTLTEYYYQED